VAVFARRPGPLAEAERAIEAARRDSGQRVLAQTLDATDAAATRDALASAAGALGAPDLVVACAGRARPARFEAIGPARLEETLRQNVVTAWSTAQAALPHLRARGGTLVLTSSLAGLIGVFGYTDYCASKFALVGLAEALRGELEPQGVGVAVLCPPDTDTPGFAEEEKDKPEETRAVSAAARLLRAEDVAGALFAGLARGRFLIVPGREARLAAFAKRHWPGLVARVMARDVRRAQDRRGADPR
jgi:NAD(P)-dependent dehydrogenase (short-subunit alcohol dehydrogenase family)